MNVALLAEIRRLAEIEHLSQRAIARRLHCCRHTVKKALAQDQPPSRQPRSVRSRLLAPYQAQIDKNLCSTGKDVPSSAGEGSQKKHNHNFDRFEK